MTTMITIVIRTVYLGPHSREHSVSVHAYYTGQPLQSKDRLQLGAAVSNPPPLLSRRVSLSP